jgi:hypothetical protein
LADVVGASIAMANEQTVATEFNEVSDIDILGARWIAEAKEIQSRHWKV